MLKDIGIAKDLMLVFYMSAFFMLSGGVTAQEAEPHLTVSLKLDGRRDYVHAETEDWTASEYSIAVWVKSAEKTQPENATIINNYNNVGGGATDDSFQLDHDGDGNYRMRFGPDGQVVGEVKTEWQHLAVTYDGDTVRTYMDGEVAETMELKPEEAGTEFRDYVLGRNRNGNEYFGGNVRDVIIYEKALSAEDISRLYDGEEVGERLVAHWPLDEEEGQMARDVAGDNDGRLEGNPQRTKTIIPQKVLAQPHEKVFQPLVKAAREHPESSERRDAVRVLGRLNVSVEEVKPVLLDILKGDEDAMEVRRAAAGSLGALGVATEDIKAALLEILKDADDAIEVRQEAIKAIVEAGPDMQQELAEDSEAVDALVQLALPQANADLRAVAGAALDAIDVDLPDEATNWPMWRYDAARSAEPPHELSEDLTLHWVRELPEPERAWRSQRDDHGKLDFDISYSPVVMGDKVFVPSNVTDSVTAYSIDDGSEKWRFCADGPVRLAPAAWRGRVYFTSDDGQLYCVDAETGELDWKFRAGPSDHRLLGNERIINFWAARGGPVIVDEKVYFAAGVFPLHGVFIYALNARSGEVEWVNDTTSSAHIKTPHGGASGYGGLSPQGYLAADDEQLIVSAGRGPSPVHLDRHTGEVVESRYHKPQKKAGGYAVHAVDGGGRGMKKNDMIEERVSSLSDQIDGEVFSQLAARDRLIVTTEDGTLYCFGAEEKDAERHEYRPGELEPRTSDWAGIARTLLEELDESEGYALILGAGSGDLLRELLLRSDLHVVVAEEDPARVRALRDELIEADMYGRRAAVIEVDPASFLVQPYLFSLVLSEDAETVGLASNPATMARALDRLRPYGGLAYFGEASVSQDAVTESLDTAGVDQVSVRVRSNRLLARRTGPLEEAGQWTHQHHDALNTNLSRDRRVRLPLGVLWFGGPNNHNILPRHAAGPRPQVAGGRQVFLGVETIAARCVYTGRELWEREFPGIGHPFTNLKLEEKWEKGKQVYMSNIPGSQYIGSPFVTRADSVYLRYEGQIHRLDPATGETLDVFTPPGRSVSDIYDDEDAPDWGILRVAGDYLVTTSEPHIFEGQDLGWKGYSGTSSRRIAVMDRFDGEVQWEMKAGIGFRHNAIIATEETLYVIDGLSENAVELLARRGEKPEDASRLYALNLADGEELWSTESEVFGTYLTYSREHDILIEGGHGGFKGGQPKKMGPSDEPWKKVNARRGETGEVLWKGGDTILPGAVRGEMLIPGRPKGDAISLLTGETWQREEPLTGTRERWNYKRAYGCNQLNASENLLLFRTGYAGYFDLEHDSGTGNFSGIKSGCTANMIPADGVVNALDYTRTCTCSYPLQTSLALIHMPDDVNIEFWTRYAGASPDPRGHGINFGAPGRRVDVGGSERIWYDRGGNLRRHPSAIEDSGDSPAWVLASARAVEAGDSIRIDDVAKGEYTFRLHFAELDADVEAGERVFDVILDGEEVLSGYDIVEQAGGSFRGVVTEFSLNVDRRVEIELRPVNGCEKAALINGVELLRK